MTLTDSIGLNLNGTPFLGWIVVISLWELI